MRIFSVVFITILLDMAAGCISPAPVECKAQATTLGLGLIFFGWEEHLCLLHLMCIIRNAYDSIMFS